MYYIMGSKSGIFNTFMEAFIYQQEHCRDKKIIYSENGVVEVVWTPEWASFDCGNFEYLKVE